MASGIIQETADDGLTWTSSAAPDGFPVSGIFLKNNILYAGTYKGNVATSITMEQVGIQLCLLQIIPYLDSL